MPGTELGVRDTTMNRVGTTSQRGVGGGEQIVKKKKASNSQPQGALKKAGLKANNEGVAGDCLGGEGRCLSEDTMHHTILEPPRVLTQHSCLFDLQE